MASTGSTGSTFPKWQLAVLIGAPVALGIGYLYWKKSTEAEEGSGDKLTKKKLGEIKDKTISLDGDERSRSLQDAPAKKKAPTPLEEAQKHKNEGNTYFRDGKYDQAIKEYDLAIEKCPQTEINDLSTFYQNRAAAYEHLQKWAAVIEDCSKALECNPKYLKALKRRAKAYEQQKELAASLEDTTAACILEGFQNKHTLVLADRVLKELGKQHAQEALKEKHNVQPSKFFVKNYFSSYSDDPIKKMVFASTEPKGFVKAKLLLDQGQYEGIIAACTEEIETSEADAEYKIEALLLRATFYLLTVISAKPPKAETMEFSQVLVHIYTCALELTAMAHRSRPKKKYKLPLQLALTKVCLSHFTRWPLHSDAPLYNDWTKPQILFQIVFIIDRLS